MTAIEIGAAVVQPRPTANWPAGSRSSLFESNVPLNGTYAAEYVIRGGDLATYDK